MQTCYRHPDRETRVACSRCDRPICPECMSPSPVGMRCPECAGERSDIRRPSYKAPTASATDTPATYALIGINVLVFVAQLAFGGGATGFDGTGLTADGALCGDAIGAGGICAPPTVLTDGGEWWRIFTSGFLHGGFIHLALNMFVLYILGTLLEPAIGTRRLLGIYFVSLVAGSFGALLLSEPFRYTVGASGAIYGLFGATLLVARNRGLDEIVTQLGFWLVLNLVLTFSISGISIGGHLGGLAGGALAGMVVLAVERRRTRVPAGAEIAALTALGTIAFVACLVVAGGAAGPG
jgi:membrane associated rhomboid family serine protease